MESPRPQGFTVMVARWSVLALVVPHGSHERVRETELQGRTAPGRFGERCHPRMNPCINERYERGAIRSIRRRVPGRAPPPPRAVPHL